MLIGNRYSGCAKELGCAYKFFALLSLKVVIERCILFNAAVLQFQVFSHQSCGPEFRTKEQSSSKPDHFVSVLMKLIPQSETVQRNFLKQFSLRAIQFCKT